MNYFFEVNFIIFLKKLRFIAKLNGKYREPLITSCPYTCTASPIVNIPHQVVHWLKLMNLHWHITITHTLKFALGFTFGVAHTMSLDKCIMDVMHPPLQHHTELFHFPKVLCSTYSSPLPNLWSLIFHYPVSPFPDIICSPLRLASFT